MNIVLTGMMATGKTSVGKALARKLGMGYIDTDEMIEKDVGVSISRIFKKHGEKYFRQLEKKAVSCVSLLNNHVIATGGGVVKNKKNMQELEKKGVIVCLTAAPEEIYERASASGNRPLLKVKDPLARIKKIMSERKDYYSRADFTVDTTGKEVSQPVNEIIDFIKSSRKFDGLEKA